MRIWSYDVTFEYLMLKWSNVNNSNCSIKTDITNLKLILTVNPFRFSIFDFRFSCAIVRAYSDEFQIQVREKSRSRRIHFYREVWPNHACDIWSRVVPRKFQYSNGIKYKEQRRVYCISTIYLLRVVIDRHSFIIRTVTITAATVTFGGFNRPRQFFGSLRLPRSPYDSISHRDCYYHYCRFKVFVRNIERNEHTYFPHYYAPDESIHLTYRTETRIQVQFIAHVSYFARYRHGTKRNVIRTNINLFLTNDDAIWNNDII